MSKKDIQGEEHSVECEIWLENGRGEETVMGTAFVILPLSDEG